jgi:cation-transporting P-type ATPase C
MQNIQIRHQISNRMRATVTSIRGRLEEAQILEQRLIMAPSICSADVRPATGSVILYYDKTAINNNSVIAILQTTLMELDQIGWQRSGLDYRQNTYDTKIWSTRSIRRNLLRLLILSGFTVFHLVRALILKSPLRQHWIIAGTLLAGLKLFHRVFWDLKQGKFLSANIFLSGATMLATFTGESAAALEVIWIQEVGQLLEDYIQDRSRRAIRDIIQVSPQNAFILVNGSEIEIPVTRIRIGDILCVHNTDRIPVDGGVVDGEALVDESHITGRAEPELRKVGDCVFSGTVVQQGYLRIEAEKVGSQTYLAQVARTVDKALAERAKVERQADKLATRLLLLGTAVSVTTLIFTKSFTKTLAVQLALASPCATVLAASTAVTAALANAARNRVLIKGGVYLEKFKDVDCICFDKTGTLTEPLPAVVKVMPRAPKTDPKRILSMAAAAQCHSIHPIAKALVKAAPGIGKPMGDEIRCETILGRGVRAKSGSDMLILGNLTFMEDEAVAVEYFKNAAGKLENNGCTIVYVARNGKLQGMIALKYEFKPGSIGIMQKLRQDGVSQFHLLSGDTHKVLVRTADSFEMNSLHGDMLPEDKAHFVAQLVSEGKNVAMVGDGINDAPALAQASIGIAMGAGGAHAAIEAADIALVDNRLERIVFTRQLSRKTLSIIQQNHWFAVATDLLGAVLAITGILPPILSGATHILHTLAIMTNSSRIISIKPVAIDGKSFSNEL